MDRLGFPEYVRYSKHWLVFPTVAGNPKNGRFSQHWRIYNVPGGGRIHTSWSESRKNWSNFKTPYREVIQNIQVSHDARSETQSYPFTKLPIWDVKLTFKISIFKHFFFATNINSVRFFTSANNEHLISRPSDVLEISLLAHLTDNWPRFAYLVAQLIISP